jgi:hypothetical protein
MLDKKYYKKKKKNSCKIGIILIFFLVIVLLSQSISAHSPSSISLNFDIENQELEATITHQVSNPDSHYIYEMVIKKNDELYNIYNYTNQPSSSKFTYIYEINGTEGDVIEVKALCNQGGSLTKKVNINDENGISDDSDGSSTPGFEIVILIISLLIITFLINKKEKNR